MPTTENPTLLLEGTYHDVLRGPDGQVTWDRGWRKNTIAVSGRRLLASFLKADPSALGIDGILIGAGQPSWDTTPPPQPTPTSVPADANRTKIPRVNPPAGASFQMEYLDGANVSPTPTNRLQIRVVLGPGVPAWPDGNHPTSSLREFGLVGRFNNADVLLNYVIHPVITKDPFSTLERTIWLVF